MRVAVVTTHPIQYQVPWLRMLSTQPGIDLHVYFATVPDAVEQGREFGVAFQWDVPLLEGYRYTVLENRAARPSLTHFSGCDTPSIIGEIRRQKFDAVIVNGWGSKTSVQALVACRLAGIPCVVRGEANGLRKRAWYKRRAHQVLLKQYAAFLSIGSRNRQYYLGLGVDPSRIFATPYCVDNGRFADLADAARKSASRDDLRRSFGMQPDRRTFLFSGKFVEKKRPADLIAALAKLVAEGTDSAQVLMVGDGPLREHLQTLSAGLPVHFTGFLNQSEIGRAYAASDCLVLPSDSGETWGLVVNEAMASGLPAFVSDQVGSAQDLVRNETTGAVFPCGSIDGLAELMRASSSSVMSAQGQVAKQRMFDEFTFTHVVEGVIQALSYVTGRA